MKLWAILVVLAAGVVDAFAGGAAGNFLDSDRLLASYSGVPGIPVVSAQLSVQGNLLFAAQGDGPQSSVTVARLAGPATFYGKILPRSSISVQIIPDKEHLQTVVSFVDSHAQKHEFSFPGVADTSKASAQVDPAERFLAYHHFTWSEENNPIYLVELETGMVTVLESTSWADEANYAFDFLDDRYVIASAVAVAPVVYDLRDRRQFVVGRGWRSGDGDGIYASSDRSSLIFLQTSSSSIFQNLSILNLETGQVEVEEWLPHRKNRLKFSDEDRYSANSILIENSGQKVWVQQYDNSGHPVTKYAKPIPGGARISGISGSFDGALAYVLERAPEPSATFRLHVVDWARDEISSYDHVTDIDEGILGYIRAISFDDGHIGIYFDRSLSSDNVKAAFSEMEERMKIKSDFESYDLSSLAHTGEVLLIAAHDRLGWTQSIAEAVVKDTIHSQELTKALSDVIDRVWQ